MKNVRIIKRYQNRKLYDTHQSCYVTLEEISQIIREGNEIQVLDNKTKNDITYMTQIQLLFDQERKSSLGGDTELLKRAIRTGHGTLTGYVRKLEKQLMAEGHAIPSFDGEKSDVVDAHAPAASSTEGRSISLETSSVN